jgi:hypothetical protein
MPLVNNFLFFLNPKKLMPKLYIVVKFDFSYEGQVFYGSKGHQVGEGM